MKKVLLLLSFYLLISFSPDKTFAQLYWGGSGSWTSAGWSTTNSGPYTSAWVSGSAVIFNVPASTITGATTTFSSITANEDVTVTSGGTINTGATIATITVANGKTLDFGSQAISTAAGTGFVKNGAGSLALAGGTYTGGFTLNSGTVILRGVNGMGSGGTLTINGGTIAGSGNRDLTGKYTSIIVGGNFTLGSSVSPASSSASLTFNAPISLGANDRIISLGANDTRLNGIISSTGGGLTIANSTGIVNELVIAGSNTYTGPTVIGVDSRLALAATEVIPNNSPITLNGGSIFTGQFNETYSTLRLTENSNIILSSSSVQSHNFSASNLIGWTAGKTLIINNWQGGYNSTSGTAGKIFFGNNASGLTAQQLSQIKFFNGTVNSDAVQLSTGEIVPTGTLPISLTSFTGKAVNQTILLNWNTASEVNNSYFDVLRSVDGKSFTAIGKINGSGNSNSAKDYSFVDENPYAGSNYYQLVQHDFDGKTSSSAIISADSKIAATQLSVYASSSEVKISISSPNQGKCLLQLFDIAGRKLAEQSVAVNKGFNSVVLPLSLQNGIHFVRYTTDGETINQKFVR
ncbi:T9SS type A sorting domain-containing protein [Pedobacter cryophilus]|uniref:T9SS type A sorting domain-containing protein n=1 Tax=Pedobacter cryophilus TaxID=2571271 RepID=A0A4U1BUB0_9SPHI|nr:T9SS type A sorting domain-containing protein [Pedobacter cryophilus]TKB95244.1 T9SS type A sorting domain-containing protein [Pedobacter cryophilus]